MPESIKGNATEYQQAIAQFGFLQYGRDVSKSLLKRVTRADYSYFPEPVYDPHVTLEAVPLKRPLNHPYDESSTVPPFMKFLDAAQMGGMISLSESPGMRYDGISRLLRLAPSSIVDEFLAELGLSTEPEQVIHQPKDEAMLFAYTHASLAVGFLRNYMDIAPTSGRVDPKDEAARAFIRSLRGQLERIKLITPPEHYHTYDYWRRGTTIADWIEKIIEVRDLVHTALFTTNSVDPRRVVDAANFFNVLEGLYCILYLDRTLGQHDRRYTRPKQ